MLYEDPFLGLMRATDPGPRPNICDICDQPIAEKCSHRLCAACCDSECDMSCERVLADVDHDTIPQF